MKKRLLFALACPSGPKMRPQRSLVNTRTTRINRERYRMGHTLLLAKIICSLRNRWQREERYRWSMKQRPYGCPLGNRRKMGKRTWYLHNREIRSLRPLVHTSNHCLNWHTFKTKRSKLTNSNTIALFLLLPSRNWITGLSILNVQLDRNRMHGKKHLKLHTIGRWYLPSLRRLLNKRSDLGLTEGRRRQVIRLVHRLPLVQLP